MGEVISVISGKGGTGKTVITGFLGRALSLRDKKVLLVDLNTGFPGLDLFLGLDERVNYTLTDIFEGNCRISQALVRDSGSKSAFLLPSSGIRRKMNVRPESFQKLMDLFRQEFDYILLDTPSAPEDMTATAVLISDRIIHITMPDPLSVRNAIRLSSGLFEKKEGKESLIISRFRSDHVRKGLQMRPEAVQEKVALPLLGIIPEDEKMLPKILNRNDIEEYGKGTGAPVPPVFRDLAGRLLGEDIPIRLKVRE